MKIWSWGVLLVGVLSGVMPGTSLGAIVVVDFEELTLFTGNSPAGGGQFYNGNDGSGVTNDRGWTSQGVFFSNRYNGDSLPAFDFWSGWAYSNVVNTSTGTFTNQYAALPGGGANGAGGVAAGQNYAVAFGGSAFINIPETYQLRSVEVTNTTYAGLTVRDGSMFSKPFGGASGNDPDLFRVTFTGFDGLGAAGNALGAITVDLADYRFDDNSLDYILDQWLLVDLTPLAGARSLGLSFFSTDVGPFGINTPTYLAIDNLTFSVVPEPSAAMMGLGLASMLCLRRRVAKR
jgi:hypothetical protein